MKSRFESNDLHLFIEALKSLGFDLVKEVRPSVVAFALNST